jgi:hypothetical protein
LLLAHLTRRQAIYNSKAPTSNVALEVGVKSYLDVSSFVKAKINNAGILGLGYTQALRPGVKASFGVAIDTQKLSQGGFSEKPVGSPSHSVGVSFVLCVFLLPPFSEDELTSEQRGLKRVSRKSLISNQSVFNAGNWRALGKLKARLIKWNHCSALPLKFAQMLFESRYPLESLAEENLFLARFCHLFSFTRS